MTRLFLLIFFVAGAVRADLEGDDTRKLYNGYQMLRATPIGPDQLKLVESLESAVDAWTPVIGFNQTMVDLTVEPRFIDVIKKLLRCEGVKYTTAIIDLQRAIDDENIEHKGVAGFRGRCRTTGMSWSKYHGYDTISKFIDCLGESYNDIKIHRIGKSTEGRDIKVVEVGKGHRRIWIDGGIHAREWISPASVSYILHGLVEEAHLYSDILNTFTFYISPSINPDGYEYSRKYDRMWRKTRSRHGGRCVGVDPNRNWGHYWGGKGASADACSEIYRGPRAFSEPETQAVKNFILDRRRVGGWEMYLTFHSYGQMVLYPWGYDRVDHRDERELERLGRVAARALGRGYTVGSAAKVLYPAAGGSDDWAFGGAGIPYSYTIELPDTGTHGFILPASYISQVAPEALAATVAMARDLQARSPRL